MHAYVAYTSYTETKRVVDTRPAIVAKGVGM
jgi:hypothetical protein